MVHHCSNPKCDKTLHSLYEGRIYVFDVVGPRPAALPDGRHSHHMEHFWLCERCSETLLLERTAETGIRLLPKAPEVRGPSVRASLPAQAPNAALAS
jgi:hypothetical protein